MNINRKIITLTTDFGTADGYVAAMKGKILSMAPDAMILDISHDIPPQDIWRGAWALRRAAKQYPEGTVHLAVVDPGVGTMRSGVVIETENYVFIGPDNGLLSLAAREDNIRQVIEINEDGSDWQKSDSFDGLTLFAPIAGLIMAGMDILNAGEEAEDLVELPDSRGTLLGNLIEGEVILFDRFGNAITNIPGTLLNNRTVDRVGLMNGTQARFCSHYSEVAGGNDMGAIVNSDGLLELALFGESLYESGRIQLGDNIKVLLKPI